MGKEKKGSPNSVPRGQSTILSDPLSVQQENVPQL